MTLTELTQQLSVAKLRKKAIQDVYDIDIRYVGAQIQRFTERLNVINARLDDNMVKHGMNVLSLGDVTGSEERGICSSCKPC